MKIIEIGKDQEIKIKTNPDGSKTIEIWDKDKDRLGNLNPGEHFKIADWDFLVLQHNERGTLVIPKDLLAENERFGNTRNYKESNIKKVIEEKILPVVENAVGRDNIIVYSTKLTSVDMQNEFGEVQCRMRPLSFDEARKYNDFLVNKELPDWYWTLTPWSTEERGWDCSVVVVSPSGDFYSRDCDYSRGVRPVCILNSNIFVSKKE